MPGPLNDAELSKLRCRVTVASGDVLSYNETIIRELLDTIDVLKADLKEALDFISKVRPSQYLHSEVPGHPETVGEEKRIRDAQARILKKHGMEEQ